MERIQLSKEDMEKFRIVNIRQKVEGLMSMVGLQMSDIKTIKHRWIILYIEHSEFFKLLEHYSVNPLYSMTFEIQFIQGDRIYTEVDQRSNEIIVKYSPGPKTWIYGDFNSLFTIDFLKDFGNHLKGRSKREINGIKKALHIKHLPNDFD